jgi:hypothetical protein
MRVLSLSRLVATGEGGGRWGGGGVEGAPCRWTSPMPTFRCPLTATAPAASTALILLLPLQGKSARAKGEKTAAAADVAVARAEKAALRTAEKQVAAAAASRAIRVARKPGWYEKFHWFVTSEGLVVVAGRNAQENETLFKRYLRPQVRGSSGSSSSSSSSSSGCAGSTRGIEGGLALTPPSSSSDSRTPSSTPRCTAQRQ